MSSGPKETTRELKLRIAPEELDAIVAALPVLARILDGHVSLDLVEGTEAPPVPGAQLVARLHDRAGDRLATLVTQMHPTSGGESLTEPETLSAEVDDVSTELIQMEMLARRILLGRSTRSDTLKSLIATLRGRLPQARMAIALADDGDLLEVLANRKLEPEAIGITLSAADGPVGQTLRSGAPRAYPAHLFNLDKHKVPDAESVTVVPLQLRAGPTPAGLTSSVLGAILLVTTRDHPLSGADMEYLRRMSVHGTVLVHNATLVETLRTSEETYRTIVERAQLGMALVGRDGTLRHVNNPLGKILGREVKAGDSFLDWVVQVDRELVEELLAGAGSSGEHPPPLTTALQGPEASVPIELSITPIQRQIGPVTGHVAIVRDMTRDLALQDERERLEREVQQAEKLSSLGKFIAGIAHELNNPLAVVLGYTELLSHSSGLDNKQRRALTSILEHARRCGRIVEDLLTFARHEESPGNEPMALNTVLREVVASVEDGLDCPVRFHLSTDSSLEDISGSRHSIFQVFVNILHNAVDALRDQEQAQRDIFITTRAHGDQQEVEIRDTGPGLQDPKRVFDPFYTTKPIGKGTGLGLSIAYGIIRDHKGDLRATNAEAGGACFTITLPALQATDEDPIPKAFDHKTTAEFRKIRLEPGNVLVVDDEPAILALIADTLEGFYNVTGVATTTEALSHIETEAFDLVLSDLRLEDGLTGIDLYERIMERSPELLDRFVFMTGDTLGQASRVFLDRTQRPCLPKPFRASDLFAFVRKFAAP